MSVDLTWHVSFTPDFGRVVATQRTDASAQLETSCRAPGHGLQGRK